MPQQPASSSTTSRPGCAAATRPSPPSRPAAFWWQWPWKRMRVRLTGDARVEDAERRRRSPRRGARRRAAPAPATAAPAGRPAAGSGAPRRSVSTHDGSQPTIGTPRSARRAPAARPCRPPSAGLVEQALGDARAPAAAGALQPHAAPGGLEQLDRRPADRRLGEGRERIGEEDDVARGAPRARARPHAVRYQRSSDSRAKRGSGRSRAIPPSARASARIGARRRGRFDSGAVAAPSRLSVRIAPNSRERSGTPWMSW